MRQRRLIQFRIRMRRLARRGLVLLKSLPSRWKDRSRWVKTASMVGLAIAATIIGDSFFQLITGEFSKMSWWGRGIRTVASVGAILLAAAGIEEVLRAIRRPEPEVNPQPLEGLEPRAALILMASSSAKPEEKQGAIWTAWNYFSRGRQSPLRFVYIIHSSDESSLKSAQLLAQEVEAVGARRRADGGLGMESELQLSDFESPEKLFRAVNLGIAAALTRVDEPEDIVVEATGGTAMASIGAALAKIHNQRIVLSYIPAPPGQRFGMVPKLVRLSPEHEQASPLDPE